MASNNLRILYNNLLNNSNTLVASSTTSGFPITNTKKDTKGIVWRSNSVTATVTITWATPQKLSCVVMPFNNLTNVATTQVQLYDAESAGILLLNTGTVVSNFQILDTNGSDTYKYSYGSTPIAVNYFTSTENVRRLVLTINNVDTPDGYIELSRVLCGEYWSPTYNTEYGLTVNINDTSTHSRSQAGNLVTDIGTINKSINFSLPYLLTDDLFILSKILLSNGMKTPVFISLFPQDTDTTREAIYQIYGKLSSSSAIAHTNYLLYGSSMSVEEI